jgi:hypothetical protein
MDSGTAYRIPFQTRFWSHTRKVPGGIWIGHTCSLWLWGYSPFTVSSPGPVFHGPGWLLWRPVTTVLQFVLSGDWWRINQKGKHNRSVMVAVQGPRAPPPATYRLPYILLFQTRGLPNLEGQVAVFTSPRYRVTQLYPQAPSSLFVASYDSQGYGGGIRTSLHTGLTELVNLIDFKIAP